MSASGRGRPGAFGPGVDGTDARRFDDEAGKRLFLDLEEAKRRDDEKMDDDGGRIHRQAGETRSWPRRGTWMDLAQGPSAGRLRDKNKGAAATHVGPAAPFDFSAVPTADHRRTAQLAANLGDGRWSRRGLRHARRSLGALRFPFPSRGRADPSRPGARGDHFACRCGARARDRIPPTRVRARGFSRKGPCSPGPLFPELRDNRTLRASGARGVFPGRVRLPRSPALPRGRAGCTRHR